MNILLKKIPTTKSIWLILTTNQQAYFPASPIPHHKSKVMLMYQMNNKFLHLVALKIPRNG